jgi:hypothetical protein
MEKLLDVTFGLLGFDIGMDLVEGSGKQWSERIVNLNEDEYSLNFPILFSMLGGNSPPVFDSRWILMIALSNWRVCSINWTQVFLFCLTVWEIQSHSSVCSRISVGFLTWAYFTRDWTVFEMASKNGALRLRARISKESAIMVMHVIVLLNRVRVAERGKDISVDKYLFDVFLYVINCQCRWLFFSAISDPSTCHDDIHLNISLMRLVFG